MRFCCTYRLGRVAFDTALDVYQVKSVGRRRSFPWLPASTQWTRAMAEDGMLNRSQPVQPEQHSPFDRISAHHRALTLIGVVVVALGSLKLGVSLGTVVLLGIVLLCPLMMLGMMVGMRELHHGHQAQGGSNAALEILRERYARGELSQDQFDRMRRNLS